MTKIEKIAKGLTILAQYEKSGVEPGHDIIYAGPDLEFVCDSDARELEALGWFIDDESESWAIWT